MFQNYFGKPLPNFWVRLNRADPIFELGQADMYLVFVRFLEELKTQKIPFEIN